MERQARIFTFAVIIAGALGVLGATFGRDVLFVARPTADAVAPSAAWEAAMARLTATIDRGERYAAVHEWRAAYAIALTTRRWEPLLAVGDTAARMAGLEQPREPFRSDARSAYVVALRVAERTRSAEGLLATAEAFDRLGDGDVARHVRRLAARLASEHQLSLAPHDRLP